MARARARRSLRSSELHSTTEGFDVQLTCYNAPLANHLKRTVPRPRWLGFVDTFHSLCFSAAAEAGLTIPDTPDAEWWQDEAPLMLMAATREAGTAL